MKSTNNEENKIELRSEEFQEVLGHVPHWILRWGITLLAAIVVILLVGSALFKYPDTIQATIVLTGSIPPASIVAGSSGKINELIVEDNQTVQAGEYLAVIDNPAKTGDILFLKNYLANLNSDLENGIEIALPTNSLYVGNLQSNWESLYIALFEYMEYKRVLYYPQKTEMTRKRIVQYEQQYENLFRQQQITQEQLGLTKNQLDRDSVLHQRGVLSDEEMEISRSQYLQNLLSQENMLSSLNNMRIQIAQLKESLLDVNYQDVEKLNQLHTQIRSLSLQLKTGIQTWELNYVLCAPITGKVSFTKFWTVFQNVSAGEDVFTILPVEGFDVIGKAYLPIARSGKVKTGQQVNVRLDNFPDSEFGILKGRIKSISSVPVSNEGVSYYALEINFPSELTTTYKKELPYLPNMEGTADIITEDISFLERLILPIKKIINEGMM